MNFKESQTYKNLETAFAGEAKAHTKYQYYASQAKKDGYEQIKKIFEETAHNEKEHAKIWFKLLNNKEMPKTIDNLIDGVAGEHYEASEMYIGFYKTAQEEGYEDIANLFLQISQIEQEHEKRYQTLLNNIKNINIFHKNNKINWQCSNCGFEYTGKDAPIKCPVCEHPQSFFYEKQINYL